MKKVVHKKTTKKVTKRKQSVPKKSSKKKAVKGNTNNKGNRSASGPAPPTAAVVKFLDTYVSMPKDTTLVVASWIVASHMSDCWDKFPHLAITSPEKRCGKTTLLSLMKLICFDAINIVGMTSATVWRLVKLGKTLLIDEAQSLSGNADDAKPIMEILCAGIDKTSNVTRCDPNDPEGILTFNIYGPKAIAMIGTPQSTLADRCIPVHLKRKTKHDVVESFRSRVVDPLGQKLHDKIRAWCDDETIIEQAEKVYDAMQPLDIENDRMDEMFTPLRVVLQLSDMKEELTQLEDFIIELDAEDRSEEDTGIHLLKSIQEIFDYQKFKKKPFIGSTELLGELIKRVDEPWATMRFGQPMTPNKLALLLKAYGIRSEDHQQKIKGKNHHKKVFTRTTFEDAWERYL